MLRIFCILGGLLLAMPVQAGCVRYQRTYYETQEVFIPVAVPVAQPVVFQYLPALGLPTFIGGAVAAPAAAAPAAKAMTEADIEKLVQERIAAKQLATLRDSPDGPPPVLEEGARPLAEAIGILKGSCFSCHNAARPAGKVQLFDKQGAYAPNVGAAQILEAVLTGRMPKTAHGDLNHPTAIKGSQRDILIRALQ